MRYAVYDIEADALLMDVTTVHCLVIVDVETREVFRYRPDEIVEGIAKLKTFDRLIGHNERMYDRMVLRKLYPKESQGLPPSVDTLLISRVWFPDMYTNPIGGHGLQSWGVFLGHPKGKHTEWDVFSEEMLEYCVNDCMLTLEVFEYLYPKAKKIPRCIRLEHAVADIIADQVYRGVEPDPEAIRSLLAATSVATRDLVEKLQEAFPPTFQEMKTPRYWYCDIKGVNCTHQEPTKGALVKWMKANPFHEPKNTHKGPMKVKKFPFNPGSGDQIAARFQEKYGWKPKQMTDGGKPATDDAVLSKLKYPEAQMLRDYRVVKDREEKALDWESRIRIDTGRIHGGVTTNGTITGRMSHSQPNLAQVPKCGKPWGEECRSCFRAAPGKVLVGADASGLELRMFAHYVARWDKGEYSRLLLESDIHTHNQELAGLSTRDQAKTFIYGLFYGAGDAKLGSIVGGSRQQGMRLRARFMDGLPAYNSLTKWIEFQRKKYGCLVGLDGRRLPIRSPHMALNTLLQSAGAVVMKQALVFMDQTMKDEEWDAHFVLNVHDEWQIECDPTIAQEVGRAACYAIQKAGEAFDLACPLAGDYSFGATWKDTH